MSDLISREIIMGEIRGWQEDIHDNEYDANRYDFVFDRIYEIIDEISTVDAVEVVRCRDCCKWEDFSTNKGWGGKGYCRFSEYTTLSDDFCSYGKCKEVR